MSKMRKQQCVFMYQHNIYHMQIEKQNENGHFYSEWIANICNTKTVDESKEHRNDGMMW